MKNGEKSSDSLKKLITASVFASLVFICTAILPHIPLNIGYVHIGDAVIFISALFLSPIYAAVGAGIGSALADLLAGYAVWIPATFLIKAVAAFFLSIVFQTEKKRHFLLDFVFAAIAGVFIALGYLLYESVFFGFAAAIVSFPANLLQGAVSTVLFFVFVNAKKEFLSLRK